MGQPRRCGSVLHHGQEHSSFKSRTGSQKSHPSINITAANTYLSVVLQTVVQSSFFLLTLNKTYSIHISHSVKGKKKKRCNLFPVAKRSWLIIFLQNVN